MTGDPIDKEKMCFGHLTDLEMANKVRMLYRDTLDHEAVVTGARDRIMWLSQENARLIAERDEYKAKMIEFSEKGKAVLKEREKSKELNKDFSKIIHDHVVLMQAAWIEWQHGKGAEKAMVWIENALIGPGQLPDEDEPYSTESQAWYDANKADPFPKCFCGRPSNILWMGKGFCCEQHYSEAKAKELVFAVDSEGGHCD
ncbi:MAG: hypothetical protein Q7S87_04935 [Agitococcus sp.]|nr:hypothetical protein [Agitococcus sp.]